MVVLHEPRDGRRRIGTGVVQEPWKGVLPDGRFYAQPAGIEDQCLGVGSARPCERASNEVFPGPLRGLFSGGVVETQKKLRALKAGAFGHNSRLLGPGIRTRRTAVSKSIGCGVCPPRLFPIIAQGTPATVLPVSGARGGSSAIVCPRTAAFVGHAWGAS